MRWFTLVFAVALSGLALAQTSPKPLLAAAGCGATVHRSAAVQIDRADVRRVREPVVVRWRATGTNCRDPAFLVISVPPWVRPKGEGFFAVAPATPGPFGANPWPDSTRIVVPLNLGRLTSDGLFSLLPYRAARMPLRWKVVLVDPQARTVNDVAGSEGAAALDVAVGPPVISIRDPFFSDGVPRRAVLAPDQKARLDDYGAYFRLVDARTSEPLYESAGSDPRFSPTGRFVYYLAASGAGGKGDSTALQVFDRELGDLVISRVRGEGFGQDAIVSVRWGFGDSILSLGTSKGAMMETHAPLIDRPPYSDSLGPNCCTAIQEKVVLEVDWDNLGFGYASKETAATGSEPEDPEAGGYGTLLFSPGEEVRKLSAAAGALLDELKRRRDRDPENEINPKAPDGRTADEITGPLAAEAARLFEEAEVADTTVDEYPATAKWDSGGRTVQVASAPVGGGRIRGRRGLDQLVARPFGNLEEARQGTFRQDRFAQRLMDLGLKLQEPASATPYAAPNRDDYEKRDGKWIPRLIGASVPGISSMVNPEGYCVLLDQFRTKGKVQPVAAHDALDARRFEMGQSQAWLVSQACSVSPSVSDYQLYIGLLVARSGQTPTLTWLNERPAAGKTIHDALDLGRIAFPAPLVEAQLFDGRHLVFAVGDRADVLDYDIEAGTAVVLQGAAGVSHSAADRLYRTTDGRVIRLDIDGGIHLYSAADGAEYLQGRYVDDEFVLYDSDGHFDGTDEGARYVYLRFAGQPEPASLSQFRATLRDAALTGSASRGQRFAGRRPDLQPPPTVDAAFGAGQPGSASIDITASSPVGLTELRVFLDGRLVRSDRVDGTSVRRTAQVALSGPARWITVQGVDRLGTESMSVTLPVSAAERSLAPRGRIHAVAAGTDLYDDPQIRRLDGAAADARAFFDLVARSKLYDPGVPGAPIVNSPTMREDLLSRLRAVASAARPEDTTMVLLSGHGMRGSDGRLFLATKTTRTNDLEDTAMPWTDVADAFKAIPGRVFVFLDVCHAGAAGASNEAASALLLDPTRPLLVLSASKGRQSSLETAGSGVFTGMMRRLLARPELLDADRNGAIELQELYGSLKRGVQTATAGAQTPWVARNGMVGPVPMF
jgi:hypothetical protein